jgi:hypothetical protein
MVNSDRASADSGANNGLNKDCKLENYLPEING